MLNKQNLFNKKYFWLPFLWFITVFFLISPKIIQAGHPSLNDTFSDTTNWTPISGSFINETNFYHQKNAGENSFILTDTLFSDDFSNGEPAITTSSTPFTDTFTQTDGAAADWTPQKGTFTVTSNEYVTTSTSTTLTIPTNSSYQNWTNYRFKARVKNDGAADSNGYAMLYFRIAMSGGSETGYVLRLRQTGSIDIYKRINGAYGSSIGSISNTYPKDNNYHDIILTVIGNTFNLWIDKGEDQKPDFSVSDSTYTTGTIGLGTANFNSHFDNVQVDLLNVESSLFNVTRPSFYGGGGQYYSIYTSSTRSLSSIGDTSSNTWTDYRIKTKIKGIGVTGSSSNYAMVYFHTQWVDSTHENSYVLLFRQNGNIDLYKNTNALNTFSSIKTASSIYPQDNNWHDVIITVVNQIVKVWVDKAESNTPDFEYNNLTDYTYGTVGFGTSGGDSVFDDISIENLTSLNLSPTHIYTDGKTTINVRSSVNLDNLTLKVTNPLNTTWTLTHPTACVSKKTCQIIFPDDFSGSNVNTLGTYTIQAVSDSNTTTNLFEVKEKPLFTFVQITDEHITTTSYKQLDDFITTINNQKDFPSPNFIVSTGDNINGNTSDELNLFKSKMDTLNVTYYPISGDHDGVGTEVGSDQGHFWYNTFGPDRFSYSWTIGNFLMLAVDYDTPYGGYGSDINSTAHQTWIQNTLNANPGKKVILFYHQPLLSMRDAGDAQNYFNDSTSTRSLLEANGNVIAQFSGHTHINGNKYLNGIYYIDTNSLYGLDRGYRYIEVYNDRLETRIVKMGNIPYDSSTTKWTDSTDSTHGTENLYHFGLPSERNFRINFADQSMETLSGISLAGDSTWRDYSVQTNITLNNENYYGENISGIVFRYTDANNYYSAILDSNADTVNLQKKMDGIITNIGTTTVVIDIGTTYQLKTVAQGNNLQVFINGSKKIDTQDSGFSSGKVGVMSYLASTDYSNFLVSDLESPIISSVTNTNNIITWNTDENSSSKIEYGFNTSYGTTTPETNTSSGATNHSVTISHLSPCTTYHYKIVSKDPLLNQGASNDYTFTTNGCTTSSQPIATSTVQITKSLGGNLSLVDDNSHGLNLNIPSSFATTDANFQAHQLIGSTVIPSISTPSSEYSLVGNYIYQLTALSDIQTTIPTFDNSLTVSISYGSSDISEFNESSLIIYRWDDSSWSQLPNCHVDTSAKTVTCTTTHFSTFALFGQSRNPSTNNSSTSINSSSRSSFCNNSQPVNIPDLFQINTNKNSAKLFFTPIDTNQYYIAFSTSPNAEGNGEMVTLTKEGVQSHIIYFLEPNTFYYVKIRGQNGCMPGNWSNIMKFKTNSKIYYKNFFTPVFSVFKKVVSDIKPITTKTTNLKITPTPPSSTKQSEPTQKLQPVLTTTPKKHCFLWWCW